MSEKSRHAVKRYFESMAGDAEAFVSLFSPDVHFEDPVGTPVFHGHDGVAKFNKGVTRAWSELEMRIQDAFLRGERAAVRWTARGRSTSGKEIEFEGINVFEVDDDGKITRVEGYWDFENVIAQM